MIAPHVIAALLGWPAAACLLAWMLPRNRQVAGVAFCGMGLLATLSWVSLLLLVAGTALTWAVGRYAARSGLAVGAAIAAIAAGYFGLLAMTGGGPGASLIELFLPLGVAYYVLRFIHYLIEAHRGGLRDYRFEDYLAYQFLPSTMVAGPIHRFDEFLRDQGRRRWDPAQVAWGLERILTGLFKIVLVANLLIVGKLAPMLEGFTAPWVFWSMYGPAALHWVTLYFQFGGFSDVAVGFAAIAGFRIRENFLRPWLARNIGDFWQRWHASLSSWCRDYVYGPVAAMTRSHLAAATSSMVVLALWHAISPKYLLWGLYHGVGIAAWRAFDRWTAPAIGRLPGWARAALTAGGVFVTLNFVILSFPAAEAMERIVMTVVAGGG